LTITAGNRVRMRVVMKRFNYNVCG
jgi:hypothetical protein